jgi:hypothetical protein
VAQVNAEGGVNGAQLELERAALCGIVEDPAATWPVLREHWGPGLFAIEHHQEAAAAAVNRLQRGELVDTILVAADLMAAGNAPAATTLCAVVRNLGSVAAAPEYVRRLAVLRDARASSGQAEAEENGHATRLLDVSAIFAPLPPVRFLCQPLDIAPGAPVLAAGYGFSGKTLSVQDAALAVASGTSMWGRFPVRAGRVLHLDYEQGAHLTSLRYQRLARARGIDPRELGGRLVLAPMPSWYLDSDPKSELARIADGFDLVLVDSFRAGSPLTDENASEARIPLDRLTRLSEKIGATFVVVHHARKPTRDAPGGDQMAIRGSGALFDACGSVLVFSAERGEPTAVTHRKARITGRTHPDFRLWVEDVEVDGDPTAGLRVSVLDAPTAPAKETPSDRYGALKRRVLELVRDAGTVVGGVNALRAQLGCRKDDLCAAVDELEAAGILQRGGTAKKPTFTYTGSDAGTTADGE